MNGTESSFRLQPDNWFLLLHRSTRPATESLDTRAPGSFAALFRISRLELQFVFDQFLEVSRRSSDDWVPLPDLLDALRAELLTRREEATVNRQQPLLLLPGFDSPVLEDSGLLAALCAGLPWLRNHPCLKLWARQLLRSKDTVARGRSSTSTRSLLEIASSLGASSLIPSLRKIHNHGFTPDEEHDQEVQAKELGFLELLGAAHDWLGLDRRRRRRRPFLVKKPRAVASSRNGKVEVLLLDSGRPRNREASLRSVEAQSLAPANIRVLPESRNLTDNLLKACRESQCDWLSLVRSGDSYHPQRLAECMALAARSKDAALVCTAVHLVDARGLQVTAKSSSRLEHGEIIYDWIQIHEKQRPRSAQAGKLLHALQTCDFVLSPSNLFCRREFLAAELDNLIASPQTLAWQLAFIAAQKASLLYRNKKLLAIPLPKARELFTPGSGQDLRVRSSFDPYLQRRLLENVAALRPDEDARLGSLQKQVAQGLAERDRLKSELELTRRTRDRLEKLLSQRRQSSPKNLQESQDRVLVEWSPQRRRRFRNPPGEARKNCPPGIDNCDLCEASALCPRIEKHWNWSMSVRPCSAEDPRSSTGKMRTAACSRAECFARTGMPLSKT